MIWSRKNQIGSVAIRHLRRAFRLLTLSGHTNSLLAHERGGGLLFLHQLRHVFVYQPTLRHPAEPSARRPGTPPRRGGAGVVLTIETP